MAASTPSPSTVCAGGNPGVTVTVNIGNPPVTRTDVVYVTSHLSGTVWVGYVVSSLRQAVACLCAVSGADRTGPAQPSLPPSPTQRAPRLAGGPAAGLVKGFWCLHRDRCRYLYRVSGQADKRAGRRAGRHGMIGSSNGRKSREGAKKRRSLSILPAKIGFAVVALQAHKSAEMRQVVCTAALAFRRFHPGSGLGLKNPCSMIGGAKPWTSLAPGDVLPSQRDRRVPSSGRGHTKTCGH